MVSDPEGDWNRTGGRTLYVWNGGGYAWRMEQTMLASRWLAEYGVITAGWKCAGGGRR